MEQRFYDIVESSPVIAAVKDEEGLEKCCMTEELKVLFILFGDVCSIAGIVDRAKQAGKTVMVHIDLIHGLSGREIAVDFIRSHTRADGIITTKPNLAGRARELGLCSVLRFFVIDSMAFQNVQKQLGVRPDFIEILPGVMPKIIRQICKESRVPVIAGGLIMDKEDVMNALSAGAIAVSTTSQKVWFM